MNDTRLPPWRPANNGTGKLPWFLYRNDSTPLDQRYHTAANGRIVRYGSMARAQNAANKLNQEDQ